LIVRIAGEGRWFLPSTAEPEMRQLDNAVLVAVDDVREDLYPRLLAEVCHFVRTRGELLEAFDQAGDADITIPPPRLPLRSAIDVLFDAKGFEAEQERD
jgi:hypothetical protein